MFWLNFIAHLSKDLVDRSSKFFSEILLIRNSESFAQDKFG
nr:MAG TPA: hypothetical protein [Caudoviricetes sp.]